MKVTGLLIYDYYKVTGLLIYVYYKVIGLMVEWSGTWLMRFNVANCNLLKITRQCKPLPTKYNINSIQLHEVSHDPYLGVEFSSDLSWKIHTSNISSKAERTCSLLRRHISGCKQEVKSPFTSLVRLHVGYISTVWDPHYKQDILEVEKNSVKGCRICYWKTII